MLRDVEALFARVLEGRTWTGRRGPTKHAAYAALLLLSRRHGRRARGGVKVYVSERALAELAGTSRTTVRESALPGLFEDGLVYRASEGRGTKAGALVLRVPQTWSTQPHGDTPSDSGPTLRDVLRDVLRLRWGAGRAGKTCALLLSVARFGELTISELCERTGRRRDNVRRSIRRLEGRGLVECSCETVRLVADFRGALRTELEVSGILRAERLQRERHKAQREGFELLIRERRRERARSRVFGLVSELEPVEVFAPDITDHTDPDQFRNLAGLIRSEVETRRAANPLSASELARRHLERLQKEHPDFYAHHRCEPRKLSWEIAGLGWTRTVYSHDTIRAALSELERVEVAA